MSLRRALVRSVAAVYALAVAVLIVLLSGSSYEFMVGEVDGGRKLTLCDLPAPVDDARDVCVPVTCALVLVLAIPGAVHSVRSRRVTPTLVLGCMLMVVWFYRFFLRTLGC